MIKKISVVFVCVFLLANFMISNDLVKADENNTKNYLGDNLARKNWTFMFYDDADFISAGDPFDTFAYWTYSGENLNVIVLQDTEHGPAQIWRIGENHNKSLLKEMGEINMGDYKTLERFISFCKNNFSADRYILSFYNHGTGWKGCCNDDTSKDSLTMDEIQKALTETDGIDIVCFSAPCLMGALESVYELRDCVDVYIGSEETSGYTWWSNIMKPLCDTLNQNPNKSNVDLGKMIIQLIENDSYNNSYNREDLTMSAIRTDKMNDLGRSIDILSRNIIDKFKESYPIICLFYQDVQSFWTGNIVDIYDFAEKYKSFETSQTIRSDLDHLLENLTEVIIAETHGSNKPGAHGLSIYFPNTSYPIYDTKYGDLNYGLDFTNDTHWDEFLEKIWLKKSRGISVGIDIVGSESSISEILNFVDDCNINMLIVDFGWITWSWNNTHFSDVSTLIDESKQRNIPTWLMYRARTLEGEYQNLQHQVYKNGIIDERWLCFTDPICRNWSIAWAHKLLEKYTTVDGIILYNPDFLPDCCYCPKCLSKFKNDTGTEGNPNDFIVGTSQYDTWLNWRASEIVSFIGEWKNNITSFYPGLKIGLILNSGDEAYSYAQNVTTLGNMVDMVCPFVVLDSVTDNNFAGRICNDTKKITNATVTADIKIYGPYKNSNEDIINAITSSLNSNGDGFFIWDYGSLNSDGYTIEPIKYAYNPSYLPQYYVVSPISNHTNSLQYLIVIFEFLIAATLIAIIFYFERKRK